MVISGLQKLTLLDYPQRIACTVFAKGCNLACPFCHNTHLLKGGCDALDKSVLTEFLTKRKGILEGVCLSGGEPLMQDGALDFLEFIKGFGYKVKLDTNGCYPQKLQEAVNRGLVDYIAMDIKSSKENYSLAAGIEVDIEDICRSVKIVTESGIDYEFRTTAVKGLHSITDFNKIADWISGADRYFIQQFINSGSVLSNDCSAFSKEEMQILLQAVKPKIPSAEIRGI